MLITVCFLLCVISVPLAGGRLSALVTFPLRHSWLLFAALALQIGIISVFPGSGSVYIWVHIASYGLLLIFLAAHRNLPGLWVITVGTLMNFVAITTNDGVMPATMGALRSAGKEIGSAQFANSAHLVDPNYAFLGDVFAIPAGFPLANVFSAGDVCIVLGAFLVLHQVCATRFFPPQPKLTPLQSIDGRSGSSSAA